MPPKLQSDDGEHIVIRPLALVDEKDLEKYATAMDFPIIPCNLCGSQENLQRKMIKSMLNEWEKDYPNRKSTIFKALNNVAPSHLLDNDLFDFLSLSGEAPTDLSEKAWLRPKQRVENQPTEPLEKPIIFQQNISS